MTFAPPAQDSATSRAAAKAIKPASRTLEKMVLAHIRACDNYGATDQEIQQALSLSGDTERPRRWQLVKYGLICNSGFKHKTDSGLLATVWRAE